MRSLHLCLLSVIISVTGGLHQGADGRRAGGGGSCDILAPKEFNISSSGDVDVIFGPRDGTHAGGAAGGGGSILHEIILDGAKVGKEIKCPSSFKLKGLSVGLHTLQMVPAWAAVERKGLDEEGRGEASAAGRVGTVDGQLRQFWVASVDFGPGGRFAPPADDGVVAELAGGGGRTEEGITIWVIIPGKNPLCPPPPTIASPCCFLAP